jgi:pimeloyl-ACP methyl ester carboxylesterase
MQVYLQMLKSKILSFLSLAFILSVFCAANVTAQTADKNPPSSGKNPVIIIPGISGSQLVNPKTGKTVWFNVRRDKDDDLRLPMTSTNLTQNRDTLIAKDIIREVKLPGILPDVEVYQGLIDSLKARGFSEADWNKPQATDVFYVFPYDWRRDNVETARLLIQKIEAVKRTIRRPNLKFDIIAHSMGGLIARYAAMYGAADLLPEGRKPVPSWAGAKHINKILMFGTPNEGAVGSFDAVINGYTVVSERNLPFIDDFRPEDVLSSPALFQLLPHQATARFFDENLQPLKIDFYNPQTWRTYGWGAINDPKFLGKLKDAARIAVQNKDVKPEKLAKNANFDDRLLSQTTHAQIQAYFATVLSRAKRFQIALDAATPKLPIQLFAYGGNCLPTLDAVVLMRNDKKDRWETLTVARDIKTASGKVITSKEVKDALFVLGDGRVTRRSLLAESESSKGGTEKMVKTIFPVNSSFFACGLHTQLFLEKTIQDSFLSALIVEQTKQP